MCNYDIDCVYAFVVGGCLSTKRVGHQHTYTRILSTCFTINAHFDRYLEVPALVF